MRRLDIGIASYRNPQRLAATLRSIEQQSITDWRCCVVHNPSDGDAATREIIAAAVARNSRFHLIDMQENAGYAGAVNVLLQWAETEYIAYCDNDIEIKTRGWDELLCSYLDRFHEIGMVFPGVGPYAINCGPYHKVMWGVGFCWILNRLAMSDTGLFDAEIGHQNECDYALRLRMAGWLCACAKEVSVVHYATATSDPAAIERINRGVVQFVNKWCKYFGGKSLNYHSPNVLRWEDWPPNALYLEEYWKARLPGINENPQVVTVDGREMDLIAVPRYKGFYRGRVI